MRFRKTRLAEADRGYSVAAMSLLGEQVILCASEGTDPGLMVRPGAENLMIADTPGGCMGFAPVSGEAFLMVTRFYAGYRSEAAGIDLCTPSDRLDQPWGIRRVLDMPYVHRIATVDCEGATLIAATICGSKAFKDDWSSPGSVYAVRIPDNPEASWDPQVVLPDIHTNHGLSLGRHNGKDSIFISGDEGAFALTIPESLDAVWETTKLLETRISEICAFDLDGDGVDELVTIEPFHGDSLVVYKLVDEKWKAVFKAQLGWGHGLWVGEFAGARCAIVGNRSGNKNLCCYRYSGDISNLEEIVIDEGTGTTNVEVLDTGDTQQLIAANPVHREYVLYEAER